MNIFPHKTCISTSVVKSFVCAMLPLAALSACPVAAYSAQRMPDSEFESETSAESQDDFGVYFGTISDVDLFIHEKPSSERMAKVLDLYNSTVVMNSILTDFDLYLRIDDLKEDVANAIGSMNVACVNDPETASQLEEYKAKMLHLMSLDPEEADPWAAKGVLYRYLAVKYNLENFGEFDPEKWYDATCESPAVPEWHELQARRGEKYMVKELSAKFDNATDFDARCIYAIELAHAWMAECDGLFSSSGSDILPVMESLMKEQRYSIYLYELWTTWRVLYQDIKGPSTYSEIPNEIYNEYRRSCVIGILSHIEKHPDDMFAINTCFALSGMENILRFGSYPYGNQYAVEKYTLFNEYYK